MQKLIYDDVYKFPYPSFLEWVPFDRLENTKQIGEGDSATWIDVENLNELKTHWNYNEQCNELLNFME
ncbi:kinase-like domain-containing protein [Rhizophagus clarus]|uniref:Kinase-like domain-containing protein n=1 Tax=Rhizophagus clarus TaxID=94130 RepID=A0A8H3L3N5_9GLOM|nr:kinase-like domain-containing protein [Rhizophagus clarus]